MTWWVLAFIRRLFTASVYSTMGRYGYGASEEGYCHDRMLNHHSMGGKSDVNSFCVAPCPRLLKYIHV